MSVSKKYDVVVIGGGPAGLSAALVLGRQRREVLVVDGRAPRNAPADEMHMYLSRDGFPPAELLALGRDELAAYPSIHRWEGQVVTAAGAVDGFQVTLDDGTQVQSRRIILATGQSDAPYPIEGLAERFGRSVFHCPFCHGWESRGKSIAVLAHDWPEAMLALYVQDRYSDDVVLCTDGERALPPSILGVLATRGIRVDSRQLTSVTGEPDDVTITFDDGATLQRQAVFHRAPSAQHSDLAAQLGCETLPDGLVKVDEFQATTVPGVSAVGDMSKLPAVPDEVTLVSLAAADGVRAAVWMEMGLFRSGLGLTFPLQDIPAR